MLGEIVARGKIRLFSRRRVSNLHASNVNRLCTFGGAMVGSYLGWYLGLRWGMGLAFSLGAIGSLLGVYLGWKLARRYA